MKTVLFVCVHNAGRSQMAEAFTNALAQERGLAVRGLSAGTVAGAEINPQAVAGPNASAVPTQPAMRAAPHRPGVMWMRGRWAIRTDALRGNSEVVGHAPEKAATGVYAAQPRAI